MNPTSPGAAPMPSATPNPMAGEGVERTTRLPGHLETGNVDLAEIALPLLRRGNHDELRLTAFFESPLGRRLVNRVREKSRLVFLLPAFPAKSSNREKTVGAAPDMGEFLGLMSLNAMCAEIQEAYPPGAEVVICSDGRVFNDLVMVSDDDLELYCRGVKTIIETERLSHLKTYSLDDTGGMFASDRLRDDFVERFGPELQDVLDDAKACAQRRSMIDGIHRFMKDDLSYHFPDLSKNQLMLRSKKLAYQVVQRSQTWDNFLETVFPRSLRLSIHPYPIQHRKFGVKLVATSDRWATPWHNVTIKENGSYRLARRREALTLGATLNHHKGEYAYYEV